MFKILCLVNPNTIATQKYDKLTSLTFLEYIPKPFCLESALPPTHLVQQQM